MATPAQAPGSSGPKWSAWIIGGLLGVAAALLFFAIYVALPFAHHYYALLGIGILALVFSGGAYLAEAFSARPTAQRAVAWGFFGMGFAILFATIALGSMYGVLTLFGQLIALLVVVLALIVAVAFIGWRSRALAATQVRLAKRVAWQSTAPASALDYPAAHAPTVPQVPAPPPGSAPPRSP